MPALLVGAALAVAGPARAAESGRMTLRYTLYIGYIPALEVEARLALGETRYRIEAVVAPQSWVAWALPWTARLVAQGAMAPAGGVQPESHTVSSRWGARTRRVDIAYGPDGGVRAAFDPPVSEEGREPVPDALKSGTLDPASTVAVMSDAARGGRCAGTMPVFDGRRRFDIRAEPGQGGAALPATTYSAYAGPVTACRLGFAMVAGGYRDGERSRFWQSVKGGAGRPPVDVWLAPLRPGAPPVPVYAGGESTLGWVTVYLSSYAFDAP